MKEKDFHKLIENSDQAGKRSSWEKITLSVDYKRQKRKFPILKILKYSTLPTVVIVILILVLFSLKPSGGNPTAELNSQSSSAFNSQKSGEMEMVISRVPVTSMQMESSNQVISSEVLKGIIVKDGSTAKFIADSGKEYILNENVLYYSAEGQPLTLSDFPTQTAVRAKIAIDSASNVTEIIMLK